MKCDENYEKGGGYICFLVVKPTKYMTLSRRGVVGPLRFSKIPLSDHGVHTKIVQTPPVYTVFMINLKALCGTHTMGLQHEQQWA